MQTKPYISVGLKCQVLGFPVLLDCVNFGGKERVYEKKAAPYMGLKVCETSRNCVKREMKLIVGFSFSCSHSVCLFSLDRSSRREQSLFPFRFHNQPATEKLIFVLLNGIRALFVALLMYSHISHDVVSATKPLMNKHIQICLCVYINILFSVRINLQLFFN